MFRALYIHLQKEQSWYGCSCYRTVQGISYRNILTPRRSRYSNWGACFREFCACTVLPPASLTCLIFLRRNQPFKTSVSRFFFFYFLLYHSYFCYFLLFITFFLSFYFHSLFIFFFECSNEATGTTTDESVLDSLPRDSSISHSVHKPAVEPTQSPIQ
jgi:hypothetical protein